MTYLIKLYVDKYRIGVFGVLPVSVASTEFVVLYSSFARIATVLIEDHLHVDNAGRLYFHSLVQGQFKNLTASHCKWTLPPLTRYSEVVLRTLFITVSCMIAFAILPSSLTASSAYSFLQVSVTGGSVSGPVQGLVHLNWWKYIITLRSVEEHCQKGLESVMDWQTNGSFNLKVNVFGKLQHTIWYHSAFSLYSN